MDFFMLLLYFVEYYLHKVFCQAQTGDAPNRVRRLFPFVGICQREYNQPIATGKSVSQFLRSFCCCRAAPRASLGP